MDQGTGPSSCRLEPGRNCWRIEPAGRSALIVDAADYYRHAREAMLKATSQILLIGWDVDTRVTLAREKGPTGAPLVLGPLLTWLSKRRPGLDIKILAWDEGMLSVPGRGTTAFRLLRWGLDNQISFKWDSSHPLNASHHQKILVVDDAIAFCGGIDITGDRWDTRHHRDEEPGRRRPFTRRAYEPWHDATMAVDGAAAMALGDLGRIRWELATGHRLPVPPRQEEDHWPEDLEPCFRNADIAIARTRGKEGEVDEIREIETLFVDMIRAARKFVYVETQYFASRVVAEAIGERLVEDDGPEFVILNPRTAWGWLDEAVMDPARYLLMKALDEKDIFDRFRIYSPITEKGADIYVHAKVMIVDDEMLRVGSANMNNRSMGLDSECDLVLHGEGRSDICNKIAELRSDLLAEHLGVEPEAVTRTYEETGSILETIERLRGEGRTLVRFQPEEPRKLEAAMAKNEILDPEKPDQFFEPRAAHKLLGGLKRSH
jgi:phospholipase D1/2